VALAWVREAWTHCRPAERSDTGVVLSASGSCSRASALRLEMPGRSAGRRSASILYPRRGQGLELDGCAGSAPGRADTARPWPPSRKPTAGTRPTCRPSVGSPTVMSAPGCVSRRDGSVRGRLRSDRRDTAVCWLTAGSYGQENARACQECSAGYHPTEAAPGSCMRTNGAAFSNAWMAATCGVLGIRLVHARPYSRKGGGAGKGQRLIREGVPGEAEHHGIE